MAVLIQLLDSPQGNAHEWRLHYCVKDAEDYAEAFNLVHAGSPLIFEGCLRKSGGTEIKAITRRDWDATVTYSLLSNTTDDQRKEGDNDFGFDFSMQQVKITHSRWNVWKGGANGGPAPDFGGAINFDGQTVHGVEVGVPTGSANEKWFMPDAMFTAAFRRTLMNTVGCMNTNGWRGYNECEVLLAGVSGQNRGDGVWVVTFKYQISLTEQNLLVGDILVPTKRGWDYLWIYYRDKIETMANGAKVLTKKAAAAYCERVYREVDFTVLGIGS